MAEASGFGGVSSTMQGVLSRLQGVEGKGPQFTAPCPAHDDRSPSLSIREGTRGRAKGGVLVTCHAGCSNEDIAKALGLTLADFSAPEYRRAARARQIPTPRAKPKPAPQPAKGPPPDLDDEALSEFLDDLDEQSMGKLTLPGALFDPHGRSRRAAGKHPGGMLFFYLNLLYRTRGGTEPHRAPMKDLVKQAGCSVGTGWSYLQGLQRMGWVRVENTRGKDWNTYIVVGPGSRS